MNLSFFPQKNLLRIMGIGVVLAAVGVTEGVAEFKPAIARLGEPRYDFSKDTHFPYRDPNAPKGGRIRIGTIGTFDSLNMFTVKGVAAEGLAYTYASLMRRSTDEPFTLYGYIAEGIDVAPDYSKVTFKLNKKAQFHDGTPITAEDIDFTIKLLHDKGWPRYKQYYGKIKKLVIHDPHTLTFELKPDDKGHYDPELPMIMALIVPLSKKQLEGKDFLSLGMTAPMGSGPYKIKSVDAGHKVVYERVKGHWGDDMPINKGSSNFETVEIVYTKNATTHFQEFLSGGVDIYFETNPNQWNTGYDVPAVKNGAIQKLSFEHRRPVAVKTLIFNMRKPIFEDLRVRQALNFAFDFETLNKIVFFDAFKRVGSLFENTHLAHSGPASNLERKILAPHMKLVEREIKAGSLPADLLEKQYQSPVTKGDGNQRDNLAKADALLKQAGWTINKDGKRVNAKGEVLTIEFLVKDPKLEKIALAYQRSLKHLGVELKVRLVDTVQYEARMADREFDMVIHTWSNSLSPGVEQAYYFSRHTADTKGSSNYMGVKDELIEELAKDIAKAKTPEELQGYVHNLDRFIMHKQYFIPLDYNNVTMVAYHTKRIGFPKPDPDVGFNIVDNGYALAHDEEEVISVWDRTVAWIKGLFVKG